MNKSSVYLKVYPQCFNLPVRKGIWYVAAHPSASSELYKSNCFPTHKEQKGELWKIQKCYILSLKASLPTIYCIMLPALLVLLHTRMNCLPYLYVARQVLMMKLIFKLSSKLSFFISFTSATSKRLKPQLRHESIFLFSLFWIHLLPFWELAQQDLGTTTQWVHPARLTQLLCPPSRSQSEDTV